MQAIESIYNGVCNYFEFDSLKTKSQNKRVVAAKKVFSYLMRKYFSKMYSSTVVGRMINLDHSTVLVHANKIKDIMKNPKFDFEMNNTVNEVENLLFPEGKITEINEYDYFNIFWKNYNNRNKLSRKELARKAFIAGINFNFKNI